MSVPSGLGPFDRVDVSLWNRGAFAAERRLLLHDETLRDGLQNPSVRDPTPDDKLAILHLLERVGVDSLNVGLPAASDRAFHDTVRLATEIATSKLRIKAGAAGRTVVGDVAPIVEASQRSGIPIDVMTFIGSSPIRRYVESWTVRTVRERAVEAIRFARCHGLTVTFVTEDTTRTPPAVLGELFRAAIGEGATRLCLCDTVGHATPDGAAGLVRFTRALVAGLGASVGIDWHGHEDRGLSVANALAAAAAGADRIHACVLGIGERVGNTSLELVLRNLEIDGRLDGRDVEALPELCALVARATGLAPEESAGLAPEPARANGPS